MLHQKYLKWYHGRSTSSPLDKDLPSTTTPPTRLVPLYGLDHLQVCFNQTMRLLIDCGYWPEVRCVFSFY